MFASVCLASRLHTTWHAFATVTVSFQLFALWPVLRQRLQVSVNIIAIVTSIVEALVNEMSILLLVVVVFYQYIIKLFGFHSFLSLR
jgi:hypothetical protein